MKLLATLTCTLASVLSAAPAAAANLQRAQEIVQGKCYICHGAEGESSSPLFPRLAGQHKAYLARQLADHKSGRRKSSVMQPMVEDLSASDFDALGEYFESRSVHFHAVDDAELSSLGRFT